MNTPHLDDRLIIELNGKGFSDKDIGLLMGHPQQSISRARYRLGLHANFRPWGGKQPVRNPVSHQRKLLRYQRRYAARRTADK